MLNNRLLDFTAFRQICLAWKSVKLVQLTFASLQPMILVDFHDSRVDASVYVILVARSLPSEIESIGKFHVTCTLVDAAGLYLIILVYSVICMFAVSAVPGERVLCSCFDIPAFVTPAYGRTVGCGRFTNY